MESVSGYHKCKIVDCSNVRIILLVIMKIVMLCNYQQNVQQMGKIVSRLKHVNNIQQKLVVVLEQMANVFGLINVELYNVRITNFITQINVKI